MFMTLGDIERDLPEDLKESVKARAKSLGMSVADYLYRLMLKDYLRLTQPQSECGLN